MKKMQSITTTLCSEMFQIKPYMDKSSAFGLFVLFIYTLTNFESRATIDVDFLLRDMSNSINVVETLIDEILKVPTGNDYIEMTASDFEEISPQRKHHGIRHPNHRDEIINEDLLKQ